MFRTVFPSIIRSSCKQSIRYMSYRFVDCMLAGTRWNYRVTFNKFEKLCI